jgi:hypothetical protein
MRRRKFFFLRLSLKRYIIECSNRTGTTFFISKRRPSVYVSTFFFFSFVSRCVSFHRGFFIYSSSCVYHSKDT